MEYLILNNIDPEDIEKEFGFTAVRSSGSGGQNVNKVSTKVVISFDLRGSLVLNEQIKEILSEKLKNRITQKGIIRVSVSKDRSQFKNKTAAIEKILLLINNALKPEGKRIATKPTKVSKQKRISNKKNHSVKKIERMKIFHRDE
jgi:ribosome-associated protein